MENTITITTQGLVEKLGEYFWKLGNFDASRFIPAQAIQPRIDPEILEIMLASESLLARDWNTPEEDEAWAHL